MEIDVAIFIITALLSYLISGINPAIILSRAVYGKDIRECGSKNPGFTNFKRCFGSKLAYLVMVLDLLKSALPCLACACVFSARWDAWQLGAAYACLFSVLGHVFPLWYRFKGGKGFLVCLSAAWVFHPLAGLTATCVMILLLLTLGYMSVATMLGLISALLVIPLLGLESIYAYILCAASVLIMIIRHKSNIVRLFKGKETKFNIFEKKKAERTLDTEIKK